MVRTSAPPVLRLAMVRMARMKQIFCSGDSFLGSRHGQKCLDHAMQVECIARGPMTCEAIEDNLGNTCGGCASRKRVGLSN